MLPKQVGAQRMHAPQSHACAVWYCLGKLSGVHVSWICNIMRSIMHVSSDLSHSRRAHASAAIPPPRPM